MNYVLLDKQRFRRRKKQTKRQKERKKKKKKRSSMHDVRDALILQGG